MEARAMFTIIYLLEAVDFLNKVEVKARTKYNKMQYRLLAFWDSNGESSTLVVA